MSRDDANFYEIGDLTEHIVTTHHTASIDFSLPLRDEDSPRSTGLRSSHMIKRPKFGCGPKNLTPMRRFHYGFPHCSTVIIRAHYKSLQPRLGIEDLPSFAAISQPAIRPRCFQVYEGPLHGPQASQGL